MQAYGFKRSAGWNGFVANERYTWFNFFFCLDTVLIKGTFNQRHIFKISFGYLECFLRRLTLLVVPPLKSGTSAYGSLLLIELSFQLFIRLIQKIIHFIYLTKKALMYYILTSILRTACAPPRSQAHIIPQQLTLQLHLPYWWQNEVRMYT